MFNVMNTEQLRMRAPSIFSKGSAEQTSGKYQHISTIEIIEKLILEGFMPKAAAQCNSRLKDRKAFAKHMVRFRHIDARPTVSGLYPEIILINSHDGLSSYRLMAGLYRMVCSNGLMAGKEYEEIRIRHQGDVMHNVIEGTYEVIKNSNQMLETADKMGSIKLSEAEKQIFAESAHAIRFDENEIGQGFDPKQLLNIRRRDEMNKNDLFTVFNVLQENLIKGGIQGYTKDKEGRLKRTRMRAVKSIDQNTTLNRALWSLAEKMMALKGA